MPLQPKNVGDKRMQLGIWITGKDGAAAELRPYLWTLKTQDLALELIKVINDNKPKQ